MSQPNNGKSKRGYTRGSSRGYGRNRFRGNRRGSGNRGDGGTEPKRARLDLGNTGKKSEYPIGKRLTEREVGITEFMGSHRRFAGILKERFGDFDVREISLDGKVCKLTNQTIPAEPDESSDVDEAWKVLSSETRKELELFTEATNDSAKLEIDVTDMDKNSRRQIHTIAKKIPGVVSETVTRDLRKIITLDRRGNVKTADGVRIDRRVDWSRRGGNYCRFVLHKINMDTMDALGQLASRMHLRTDLFGYAGTKDRRARTSQWITLKRVCPSRIHAAARKIRGLHVGNFEFCEEPLKLGMLAGNRFRIALRSVEATDEEIEKAVECLRDNGFVNYYGLQRFGTIAAVPTHEIGKALLQGEWQRAIDLILKTRNGEKRAEVEDSQCGSIEANLLQGIDEHPKSDPMGTLDYVPRNARLMYIHAYQSLVWNHMVTRRLKELGPNPIVGDLVYEKSPGNNSPEESSDRENQLETLEESGLDHETVPEAETPTGDGGDKEEPAETENRKEAASEQSPEDSNLPTVTALEEKDLSHYTLADVLMPKPGWKVTYPGYAKVWFEEFLAKDRLTTDLRQKNKKYSLGGTYRKILEKPQDLDWKIVRYSGYHDDLLLGDVDELRGSELPKDRVDGKHRALILEFSLNSSTYATMALREILDHDTSAHTAAARSAANQARDEPETPEKKNGNADAESSQSLAERQDDKTELPESNEEENKPE